MKFPKITSAPLTQLPADSSELTPQENYIFEKIFQPEIQMFMAEQSKQMPQKGMRHNDENNDEHNNEKPLMKKLIIAFVFTAIIILFSMSPVPSMLSSCMTSSRNLFFIICLLLFVVAFMFIPKFIK